MAITTNAQLKTAIADYLARTDLTNYIPDFIVGAETRIAYGTGDPFPCPPLRIRAMETSADMDFSAGRTLALPSAFLQMRRVYWNSSPTRRLEQTSPEIFWGNSMATDSAPPAFYILEGENMTIGPYESGTAKIIYYKKFTALATDDTEWLLANAPHVYLYGALLEAAPFIHNDERIKLWYSMYCSAINGLMNADKRDRWGGSMLRARPDTTTP